MNGGLTSDHKMTWYMQGQLQVGGACLGRDQCLRAMGPRTAHLGPLFCAQYLEGTCSLLNEGMND